MDKEDQNIEYKQSWHDEYLKRICGFANARGGKRDAESTGLKTGLKGVDSAAQAMAKLIA